MARLIQNELKQKMADEVLFGKLSNGGTVRVVVQRDENGKSGLGFEFLTGEAEKAKPSKPKATRRKSAKPKKATAKKKASPKKKDGGGGSVPSIPLLTD